MEPQQPLKGTIFLWPGYWLLLCNGMRNRRHRHVAASVLLGLDGPIRVEVDGQWQTLDGAVIAPEVEQALDSAGVRTLIVHIDPDRPLWRPLLAAMQGRACMPLQRDQLDLDGLERAVASEDAGRTDAWLQQFAASLAAAQPLDERIGRVCDHLRAALPERLELDGLAALANLSGSRLTHLFKQQTGVTLRRFLAHLKIQQALYHWQPGMQYAELAAMAGFYDQPHLVRTAREMFDAMPSVIGNTSGLTVVRTDGVVSRAQS